ncbi:very-long-chain enoyl-CoA reductase-like isoform X2 [Halichondria panicea]|uniref:very-long-chain enoyl-CoA reductase-like isoform X2 n=1 Tax=Halichondria panicea TaxID=6063 RepID=UPI00312BB5A8
MKVVVKHVKSGKTQCTLDGLEPDSTISDVKRRYHAQMPAKYPDRQQWKTGQDRKDKPLKNEVTLDSLRIGDSGILYFKDLGPQIGWTTVFLTEYAGPLLVYLPFFFRLPFIYGQDGKSFPVSVVVNVAAACWVLHYAKRLLETIFVHRFSHATMPIANIFKNSGYYWGFAAFVAYFVNHPLYTPAMYGIVQVYTGLALFIVCEIGNLSTHITLRNLRPQGTKKRKIPYPDSNPFSMLFSLVSCPNYTYEVGAWLGFTIMTQSFPALLFTLAGLGQMTQWALGKHRNYRKEFEKYPRGRKAIIPFVL